MSYRYARLMRPYIMVVNMMTSHLDGLLAMVPMFASSGYSLPLPRSFCLSFVAMTSGAREVARHDRTSVHGPRNVVTINA